LWNIDNKSNCSNMTTIKVMLFGYNTTEQQQELGQLSTSIPMLAGIAK